MQNHRMYAGLAAAVAVLFLVLDIHQVLAGGLEPKDTRPLVRVTVDGDEYVVPVFEDVQMSEARRQYDSKAMAGLVDVLRKLVQAVMVDKRNKLIVGKISLGIIPIAQRTSSNLKKLAKTDTSPKLANGYGKKMSDLIFTILEKRTDVRLTDKESSRKSFNLLQAIQNLCDISPTGLYLDWRVLKINGQSLEDYVAPLLGWARNNGYGMVLKGFSGLAVFVRSFSN